MIYIPTYIIFFPLKKFIPKPNIKMTKISRAVCGPARGPHLARGPAIFGGPQPARANFWVARIGPQLKFCKILSKFRKIRPK